MMDATITMNATTKPRTLEMASLTENNKKDKDDDGDDYDYDENPPVDSSNNNNDREEVAAATNNVIATTTTTNIHHARRLLYISHLFAQFSEVSWQFAVVLFLAACTHYQSLVLVSTYGIVVQLAVCSVSAVMGRWIDQTDRWVVARRLILWENVAVVAGTVFAYLLLAEDRRNENDDETLDHVDHDGNVTTTASTISGVEQEPISDSSDTRSWIVRRFFAYVPLDAVAILSLLGIHLFGAVAQVLDQAFLVAVERDWIVVMAEEATTTTTNAAYATIATAAAAASHGEHITTIFFKDWLSETNVAMKQIDLNCKIVAPALAGIAMAQLATQSGSSSSNDNVMNNDDNGNISSSSLQLACLFVGGLNALSLLVEYICTCKIYHLVPGLAKKTTVLQYHPEMTAVDNSSTCSSFSDGDDDEPVGETSPRLRDTSWSVFGSWLPYSLVAYFEYSISWAGLGLSLLYMNALTFGNGIISAYLLYRHVTLGTVGILRGVASAIGLCGTFVYHFSAKRLSLEATGMWSVTFQFACLATIFAAVHVAVGDQVGLILLVAGVCLSRVGLWVFDIAVTQMQQQEIPQHSRGLVGGVQQSLNAFFNFLSFTLGLVYPDPKDFAYFVLAGSVSVGLAMVLFALGVYLPRRPISHF